MKILVVGGGGREHTICWKLAQSSKVEKIYCAPGNAGIRNVAECVDIQAENLDEIAAFAVLKNRNPLTSTNILHIFFMFFLPIKNRNCLFYLERRRLPYL